MDELVALAVAMLALGEGGGETLYNGITLPEQWYMGGYCDATCYATSKDGIHWEKPQLDVVPGTNIVQAGGRDSAVVWLDLEAL